MADHRDFALGWLAAAGVVAVLLGIWAAFAPESHGGGPLAAAGLIAFGLVALFFGRRSPAVSVTPRRWARIRPQVPPHLPAGVAPAGTEGTAAAIACRHERQDRADGRSPDRPTSKEPTSSGPCAVVSRSPSPTSRAQIRPAPRRTSGGTASASRVRTCPASSRRAASTSTAPGSSGTCTTRKRPFPPPPPHGRPPPARRGGGGAAPRARPPARGAGAAAAARGRASSTFAAAGLDEASLVGEHDGLGAVVEVELGEDACDVRLDGGVADDEFAGDVGVREAAGDEPQHFELARGQLGERRGLFALGRPACVVLDQPARDRGREERVAGGDHADGLSELVGAGVLEQEAAGAGAEGLVDVVVEVERRQDQDAGRSVCRRRSAASPRCRRGWACGCP